MCTTCGCSEARGGLGHTGHDPPDRDHDHDHDLVHDHDHDHDHCHVHDHDHDRHPHDHQGDLGEGHQAGHAHGHDPVHGRDHAHAHGHTHAHAHDDGHHHSHGGPAVIRTGIAPPREARTIAVERRVLERNDAAAAENRRWLAARDVIAVDLLGAPGAGKTALLEATLRATAGKARVLVIEGDQETARDAERIRAAGGVAVQINTGAGCHLEARAVGEALRTLDPPRGSVVVIENVGNLVCPALFDLGEHAKVVALSVTEGDDKPLKYPHVFRASRLLVLTKSDLLPHVPFDPDACVRRARAVHGGLAALSLSAMSGVGVDRWCAWLLGRAGGGR